MLDLIVVTAFFFLLVLLYKKTLLAEWRRGTRAKLSAKERKRQQLLTERYVRRLRLLGKNPAQEDLDELLSDYQSEILHRD